MTTKTDYTPQQWQLLLDIPAAVGTAVMYAGASGMGSVKEALALASGILGAKDGYDGNELIAALVDARLKHGEKSSIETLNSPYQGLSPEEILADVEQKCRDVSVLLRDKARSESADYKDWALSVADQVASAAKEGGFLGIGGERVSEAERETIAVIETALASA